MQHKIKLFQPIIIRGSTIFYEFFIIIVIISVIEIVIVMVPDAKKKEKHMRFPLSQVKYAK